MSFERRMARAPIGYYVHHHGVGHAHRYANIAQATRRRFVPISELELPGGVLLPTDVVEEGDDHTASGVLHWAPVGDHRTAQRSLVFGRWLAEAEPAGVVIDVSVEAALLCRLFGVPTIFVRQHGDRTDPAHETAYRCATSLLAPFPEALEHESTPQWLRDKTTYSGFISSRRVDVDAHPTEPGRDIPGPDDVVILWGAGGGVLSREAMKSLVRSAAPGRAWFIGNPPFDVASVGVRELGWVDDVAAVLRRRPSVVGSAGNNVVADAAVAGCALIVIPQERPFREQVRHAESLDRSGLAVAVDSIGETNWSAALSIAKQRQSALGQLAERGDGADLAASSIMASFSC